MEQPTRRNRHTWTPKQARAMSRRAAMMRKMGRGENLHEIKVDEMPSMQHELSQPHDTRIGFIRCGKPLPSSNFKIEINKTLIITRNWFGTIVSSVMVGILLGIILIILDKLI